MYLHVSANGILFNLEIIDKINIDKRTLSSKFICSNNLSKSDIVISLCFSIGSSKVFKRLFINDWLKSCWTYSLWGVDKSSLFILIRPCFPMFLSFTIN